MVGYWCPNNPSSDHYDVGLRGQWSLRRERGGGERGPVIVVIRSNNIWNSPGETATNATTAAWQSHVAPRTTKLMMMTRATYDSGRKTTEKLLRHLRSAACCCWFEAGRQKRECMHHRSKNDDAAEKSREDAGSNFGGSTASILSKSSHAWRIHPALAKEVLSHNLVD